MRQLLDEECARKVWRKDNRVGAAEVTAVWSSVMIYHVGQATLLSKEQVSVLQAVITRVQSLIRQC